LWFLTAIADDRSPRRHSADFPIMTSVALMMATTC
jgi:hypothetical protein